MSDINHHSGDINYQKACKSLVKTVDQALNQIEDIERTLRPRGNGQKSSPKGLRRRRTFSLQGLEELRKTLKKGVKPYMNGDKPKSPNPEIQKALDQAGTWTALADAIACPMNTIKYQAERGWFSFDKAERISQMYGLNQLELMRPAETH